MSRANCETTDRKLVTIERITKIKKHPNADLLEIATIRGWEVIVKKDEFLSGDLCVYCEIDSVLPEREEFKFLEKTKYRIKTIKIRGVLSQGICFSLNVLETLDNVKVGDDVTEKLGVGLYSPKQDSILQTKSRRESTFPQEIPKTREERIQNMDLETLEGRFFYVTEKLDGTSATYSVMEDGTFHVCSRNHDLTDPEDINSIYWKYALDNNIEQKLRTLNTPIAFQGELVGPKIQGNPYKLLKIQLRVFSIWSLEERRYLSYPVMREICYYLHNHEDPEDIEDTRMRAVPLVYNCMRLPVSYPELLKLAEKPSQLNITVPREGIVCRSILGNPRLSFKIISNQYLLKH